MASSSLVPGYKHVETFGPDEEYESGEEVEYVTLDLGTIEPTLVPSSSTYRLIGLDTPTPYLQLSGTKLKGQHQDLLGTELLFAESSEEHHAHAQGKKPLVYAASTERRIRFKEIELRPKGEGAAPDAAPGATSKAGTAKKVKTQMEHVMGTQPGATRRGRGGRKRGGSTKARTRSAGQGHEEEGAPAAEEPSEPQPEPAPVDVIDPALALMDTSEG